MKTSTFDLVSITLKNATITAEIERFEGQNVYVRDTTTLETFKFHVDQLEFFNEKTAKKYEKQCGGKISKTRIKMGLSEGNKKLKDSSVVSFYQWNITSVVSCPFRTAMCEKLCYALKAEKMYPTVKNRRDMNLEFSRSELFVPAMIEQIQFELERKKNRNKTVFFRIHESGDFYNYEYLLKWHEISKHFKGNRQIVFMAYTKSLPMVKVLWDVKGRENVNIQFKSSLWEDTKPKFVKMTKDMGMSIFTAEKAGTLHESGYVPCPSSDVFKNTPKFKDCGACGMCYKTDLDIAIEIH